MNLDDYLDAPEVVVPDVPVVEAPTIPKPVEPTRPVVQEYKKTYAGNRKIIKNNNTLVASDEVIEASIDPKTGRIVAKGPVKKEVHSQSPQLVQQAPSKKIPQVQSTDPLLDGIDMSQIDEALEELEDTPLDPIEESKMTAIAEDKDSTMHKVRMRLVVKVERFLKSAILATRFNHSSVPDCYRELSIDMLNEILESIRDQLGKHGDSYGRWIMNALPSVVVAGVNSIESIPVNIGEKYKKDMEEDPEYIAAIEEVDIDYFETSYRNPFIRAGSSLITNALKNTVPKAPKPVQKVSTAAEIIKESGTSKTRRPLEK